jgi:carboxypeptidase Taq
VTPSEPTASPAARDLVERTAELVDLQHAAALLSWDRQTMMPPGGHAGRGRQLATLAALVHERLTGPAIGDALEALAAEDPAPGSDGAALLRLVRRERRRATALPVELVRAIALATSEAQRVWVEARERSDAAAFAGPLAEVVRLRREEADALGWQEHRYDALHDAYEPGSTKARLDAILGPLREPVRALLARASEVPQAPLAHPPLTAGAQEAFVRTVVADFGYDFARGRLDPTVHPFCQTVGSGDVRITTRYAPDYLPTALFGTMHEAGHALYEQGFRAADLGTPLASFASLGVHESQSRLWENHVGRGRPFWQGRYGALQAAFPGAFDDLPLERFLRAINRVAPSFIRVEADEVSYPLHVLLRYDLEVALLEGDLATRDLPGAWNEGMRDLLGVVPPDDAQGCLQDVHWSIGAFGYFPTYVLGSMMSAQLWEAIQRDHPSLDEDLAAGRFAPLLDWLRERVHAPGARLEPDELVEHATGAPLSSDAYLRHLAAKVDAVTAPAEA